MTDHEGAAISEAHVFLHWDPAGADVGLKTNVGIKRDIALHTKRDGSFLAELPPGFYDVFVSATGFSPDCQKVRIKPGEIGVYNAKLKPDPSVTRELGDEFP